MNGRPKRLKKLDLKGNDELVQIQIKKKKWKYHTQQLYKDSSKQQQQQATLKPSPQPRNPVIFSLSNQQQFRPPKIPKQHADSSNLQPSQGSPNNMPPKTKVVVIPIIIIVTILIVTVT